MYDGGRFSKVRRSIGWGKAKQTEPIPSTLCVWRFLTVGTYQTWENSVFKILYFEDFIENWPSV